LTVNPDQLKFLRDKIAEFLKSESLTNQFAEEFEGELQKKMLTYFPVPTPELTAAGYIGSLCTLELLFKKLGLMSDFNNGGKRC